MRARFLAFLGTLLLLAACNPAEKAMEEMIEEQNEENEDVDVDVKADGSMQIESDGVTVTTGEELPADWPEDVPMMPGANIDSSMYGKNNETNEVGGMIMLSSSETVGAVMEFYADMMKEKGWTETARATMGAQSVLSFGKDGRAMALLVTAEGDKTVITVTVGNE